MQLVYNEMEKFLKNELYSRDLFEADEPQGYDEFLICEEILLSNAFDSYDRCFDDAVVNEILRKCEGHFLGNKKIYTLKDIFEKISALWWFFRTPFAQRTTYESRFITRPDVAVHGDR